AERYQPPAAQPEESRQPVWSAGAARIVQAQSLRRPSRPFNAAPTIGDRPVRDARAGLRKTATDEAGLSLLTYLLIFAGLFILFFLIGFFLPYMLGHNS